MNRIEQLAHLLEQLAHRHSLTLQPLPGHLYGWDPLHLKKPHRLPTWRSIFLLWNESTGATTWSETEGRAAAMKLTENQNIPPLSPSDQQKIRHAKPQTYTRFGRPRHQPQPTAILKDKTTLNLY